MLIGRTRMFLDTFRAAKTYGADPVREELISVLDELLSRTRELPGHLTVSVRFKVDD